MQVKPKHFVINFFERMIQLVMIYPEHCNKCKAEYKRCYVWKNMGELTEISRHASIHRKMRDFKLESKQRNYNCKDSVTKGFQPVGRYRKISGYFQNIIPLAQL